MSVSLLGSGKGLVVVYRVYANVRLAVAYHVVFESLGGSELGLLLHLGEAVLDLWLLLVQPF